MIGNNYHTTKQDRQDPYDEANKVLLVWGLVGLTFSMSLAKI
ncbi:hypothetical protein HMPREF6745_0936 [Prevotella sp. oral taxon 472 str. F0295]|nr:hypothetical protein HMPREF6745_0936 [Prevotella sp. oral taxon 472 str. F0295]